MRAPRLSYLCVLAAYLHLACSSAEPTPAVEPVLPAPYTEPGSRGFDASTSGDHASQAQFCDELERSAHIESMVSAPIVPNRSVGAIPLWDNAGQPSAVDSLVGLPSEGKHCNPTAESSQQMAWGPLGEVLVSFDPETRLLERIRVNHAYEGTLEGEVTHQGSPMAVRLRTGERVQLGTAELDEYTGSSTEAQRSQAWLNHRNLTAIYGMIRESFFADEALPAEFDCVAARRCDVLYANADESQPQASLVVFQDAGVTVGFGQEGHVTSITLVPTRRGVFELDGTLTTVSRGSLSPSFASATMPDCVLNLAAASTFAQFKQQCIGENSDDDPQLKRAAYRVYPQRDAVSVQFQGIHLGFESSNSNGSPYVDGQAPADTDRLFAWSTTRQLSAPLDVFVPASLAQDYRIRLQAHLRSALDNQASSAHPLAAFELVLPPQLASVAQPLGALYIDDPPTPTGNLLTMASDQVQAAFDALTATEQGQVARHALTDVALVQPFVDAVLAALTGQQSDDASAFKAFTTTDNGRWCVGHARVVQDGEPLRYTVQYNLLYNAVTAISIERGRNAIDGLFNAAQTAGLGEPTTALYDFRWSMPGQDVNPLALGNAGPTLLDTTSKADLLQVAFPIAGSAQYLQLWVPGTPLTERSGYNRQIGGDRYEFVPAHRLQLSGRDTSQSLYMVADGTIGRIEQQLYHGAPELCPGLAVAHGTHLREAITRWQATVDSQTYQECDLRFNYSSDGELVRSVASLANRIAISTTADKATGVAIWR